MPSVFADFLSDAFPFQYDATIQVGTIAGGVPSDSKVAEAWIRTKLDDSDNLIRSAVAEVMADRGISANDAAEVVAHNAHLNGFRRDENGLYILDYQVSAMLKEAVSVCVSGGRIAQRNWGQTKKQLFGFWVEHVAVRPHKLYLGVSEPTGIALRFPHTYKGSGIQNEEYVENAQISFRVLSDHKFSDTEWRHIWVTGEVTVGIGASRGQGFGRFDVIKWEPVSDTKR